MQDKIKQRLVGVVVLLALLSIVLPLLLHNPHPTMRENLSVKVPPKPPLPVVPIKALSASMPQAWVVQVASFSQKANAEVLLTRLRQAGFDAYQRSGVTAQGKAIYRVYVGPIIHKKDALVLQKKLKLTLHLNGVVRRYSI